MTSAKQFFTAQEQTLLLNAIAEAELLTSGEIRLHIENYCFGNELKAARKVFGRLGMHQTAEKNGVLIYIAVRSRKMAMFADEGIYKALGEQYWHELVQQLLSQFKADNKANSLAACIAELGKQLGKFFPRQNNDRNELSNDISF